MLETVFFVYGFQEEWLQCHRIDQERSIRDDKKKLEQAKKRLSDLDVIISRLYEDYVLGNLSQDRYKKMAADYEAEQERLKLEIEVIEEWVEQREEMNDGLDVFIALTQKYVDVEELTQTIVNEYLYPRTGAADRRQHRLLRHPNHTGTRWAPPDDGVAAKLVGHRG